MMDFAEAWATLEIGQRVRVSDGTTEPPPGRRWAFWRSHNHEGQLIEKLDGPPRALKVELDKINGAQVAYEVAEGNGETFEVA